MRLAPFAFVAALGLALAGCTTPPAPPGYVWVQPHYEMFSGLFPFYVANEVFQPPGPKYLVAVCTQPGVSANCVPPPPGP